MMEAGVSSKFDVAQELLKKSPLTYEQYQVIQQACTHLLYFNEFLQVEKFITDKFKGIKCYLQRRNKHTATNFQNSQSDLRYDQIISQ